MNFTLSTGVQLINLAGFLYIYPMFIKEYPVPIDRGATLYDTRIAYV